MHILMSLLLTTTAAAEGAEYQGMVSVSDHVTLTDHVDFGGQVNLSWKPQYDPVHVYYVGPSFQPTGWWWTSPRTGMVFNWEEMDGAAPVASWWNRFSPHGGHVSLSTQTEVYLQREHSPEYFGLYMVDYPLAFLAAGLQAEQINGEFAAGFHLGAHLGILGIVGECYWNQAGEFAVHTVLEVDFAAPRSTPSHGS